MATDIKTKAFIYQGVPSTWTLATCQALSMVQIKGLVSISGFGTTHAMIDVPDLETGFTIQEKGAETGVTGNIVYRHIAADPGQADVEESCAARSEVTIRVDDPTGGKSRWYMGHIHSHQPNEGSVTSYKGATCSFTPNAPPLYGNTTNGGS